MKVFHNARVYTQNKGKPFATAFIVNNGRFVAVGEHAEVSAFAAPQSVHIDLQGAAVFPGFHDAHIHVWKVGNLLTYLLDLRGTQSIDDMLDALRDYAFQNPEEPWIQARGFNEAIFKEQRMPSRYDLDKISTDRPICLTRVCAHQVVVNTKALELLQLGPTTPVPVGGEIKKDGDGNLTGCLTETAIHLVLDKLPQPSEAQLRTMILKAQDAFLSVGMTSATDPAVDARLCQVYRQLNADRALKLRLHIFPIAHNEPHTQPLPEIIRTPHLTIDTVKFFLDGGLSGRTAALKRPYRDSHEKGVLRIVENVFKTAASYYHDAGFRLATHAIGDAAIDVLLNTISELPKLSDRRPLQRIEHCGLPTINDLRRIKELYVGVVMQPLFISELGKNFRNYVDASYLRHVYPTRSVLDAAIPLALSTDAPVVKDFDPQKTIDAAMGRTDADGVVIGESEKISFEEAVYAYTAGSAELSGAEHELGRIQQGYLADFVVGDTTTPRIKVQQTWIGGEQMWAAKAIDAPLFPR